LKSYFITIGQIEAPQLPVTDLDREYGYDLAKGSAQLAANMFIGAATMGAGCAAAQTTRVAGVAVRAVHGIEALNAGRDLGLGVADMAQNGVTISNVLQVTMATTTFVSLVNTACFTAATQVIVDEELRDTVYFTESTQSQSFDFDNINILLASIGFLGTIALTTTARNKKKQKTILPNNQHNTQLNLTSSTYKDEGLICEIDESKWEFSWRKWVLMPLLFIVTITSFYFAIPTIKTVATSTPVTRTEKKLVTQNIENIQCGDRVLGKNPLLSEADRELFGNEPTHETHYEYIFALPRDDETITLVTLLRPRNWLNENDLVRERDVQINTGDVKHMVEVWLDIPEMGTVGWAQLLSVNDEFEIKSGKGNVVTGTFTHLANNVIDLKIEGQKPIGCTDNHPFWSVDRQEYIAASKLNDGERILLYSGETKRVEQKLPRPGPEIVYNIEVFGEHVYYVTDRGLLVHNACNNPNGRRGGDAHRNKVMEEAKEKSASGDWEVYTGGGGRETRFVVDEATGRYRYPDLLLRRTRDGVTEYIAVQVGRVKKDGTPVTRELAAIKDLEQVPNIKKVFFVEY
jgi:hypothetical protein